MSKRLARGWLFALALAWSAAANTAPLLFGTSLSGAEEVPPNPSTGTGTVVVLWDPAADTMRVIASWSGLTSPTTIAHIHCCTDVPFEGTKPPATGVPTFPGFPTGVTSGSYDMTFDMDDSTNWNPAFLALHGDDIEAAQDAFLVGLQTGRAYFNIHTEAFGAGEIRGFFVPEPSMLALLAACVLAFTTLRRRSRIPLR